MISASSRSSPTGCSRGLRFPVRCACRRFPLVAPACSAHFTHHLQYLSQLLLFYRRPAHNPSELCDKPTTRFAAFARPRTISPAARDSRSASTRRNLVQPPYRLPLATHHESSPLIHRIVTPTLLPCIWSRPLFYILTATAGHENGLDRPRSPRMSSAQPGSGTIRPLILLRAHARYPWKRR